MSDVRIEQGPAKQVWLVEPCGEHGDDCYSGVQRKVLDGFPPEAVPAAKRAAMEADEQIAQARFEGQKFSLTEVNNFKIEAALAAAWEALLRSDSEQTLRISWEALYGEDS